MLDDLTTVIETEDVDCCIVVIPRPMLKTMKHYQRILRYCPLYFDTFARPLTGHSLKVFDKSSLSGRHMWVVLNVNVADVTLYSFTRFASIEH